MLTATFHEVFLRRFVAADEAPSFLVRLGGIEVCGHAQGQKVANIQVADTITSKEDCKLFPDLLSLCLSFETKDSLRGQEGNLREA